MGTSPIWPYNAWHSKRIDHRISERWGAKRRVGRGFRLGILFILRSSEASELHPEVGGKFMKRVLVFCALLAFAVTGCGKSPATGPVKLDKSGCGHRHTGNRKGPG